MQPSSSFQNTQNQRQCLNYRIKYVQPNQTIQFLPNTQIFCPDDKTRKLLYQTGQKYLKDLKQQNPLAVILFTGGYGCRSQINGLKGCKQFQSIEIQKKQTNLFNIAIKTLEPFLSEQLNITLYIICNRKNSQQIHEQLEHIYIKYPYAYIYICYQPDENVLSWNGLQTILKNKQEKLTYPGGIGAFQRAKIMYDKEEQYTLKEHILQIIKPKYVYCFGISNILQKGISYQMIGLMQHKNLSCIFKCFPLAMPIKIQEMSLVCVRQYKQSSPAWLVMQYQNIKKLKNNQQQLKKYPIWQDNFIFNTRVLTQKYPINPSQIKMQFNLRTLNNNITKLQCLIPQMTISYAVMRDKPKTIGYMCPKQMNYLMKTPDNFKYARSFEVSASPSKFFKKRSAN